MKTHEEVLKEWNGGTFLAEERNRTIAFLRSKFGINNDDAEDLFQESAIALFRHIKEDELKLENASLSSYFKRICVLQTLKFIRDNKGRHDDIYVSGGNRFSSKIKKILEGKRIQDEGKYGRDKKMMWMLVERMSSPCKEILWGFYHDDKNLDDLAKDLGKDKSVVKVRKSQCLSKLKTKKHLFE